MLYGFNKPKIDLLTRMGMNLDQLENCLHLCTRYIKEDLSEWNITLTGDDKVKFLARKTNGFRLLYVGESTSQIDNQPIITLCFILPDQQRFSIKLTQSAPPKMAVSPRLRVDSI